MVALALLQGVMLPDFAKVLTDEVCGRGTTGSRGYYDFKGVNRQSIILIKSLTRITTVLSRVTKLFHDESWSSKFLVFGISSERSLDSLSNGTEQSIPHTCLLAYPEEW
jgi:hypothetical protein